MSDVDQGGTAKTISISATQESILLSALYDKLVGTKHYLAGYPENDEPGPLDSCCDAHLTRFNDRLVERRALTEHRDKIKTLIAMLEETPVAKG